MNEERFVVLGVAGPRAAWFRELARMATAGALPIEFVTCVSVAEVRARLASGRPFSALLADAGLPGLDRDLVEGARAAGCTPVVVDDGRAARNWQALGAQVLPTGFGREQLLELLATHAAPIRRGDAGDASPAPVEAPVAGGVLVAVTGAGGAGRSTLGAALAQGMVARGAPGVVLADVCLDGAQAALHGTADVIPGLPELVEAHRTGWPAVGEVRELTWAVPARGYDVLLGLRRHRDWAALRPRAVAASVQSLRRAYGVVVADVDPDLEGHEETGSVEVEERNVLARSVLSAADAVVVVGVPGVAGVHRLGSVLHDVLRAGVDPTRVLTVVNRAPRAPRERAEITAAIAALTAAATRRGVLSSPLFVPYRRNVERAHRDATPLPSSMAGAMAAGTLATLERVAGAASTASPAPVPIRPGSLGPWEASA